MIRINMKFLLMGLIVLFVYNVQVSLVSSSGAQNIVSIKQDEPTVQKVRILIDQIRVISTKSDDLEAIGWGVMTQMEKIGKIGNPALPPIIETLNDAKESWKVRFFMAVILGEVIPDKMTVPSLVRVVSNRKEPTPLRTECIQAMSYIGDISVVTTLISTLRESNINIKITAMNTLGNLKDSRSVPYLITQLDDPDWNIQMVASRSLGRIGDSRAISPLIKKIKGNKLPKDNSRIMQTVTIDALSNFNTPEVEQYFISILEENETEDNVRMATIDGLGRMKSEKSIDLLSKLLLSKKEIFRKHAAAALAEIGNKKALKSIQQSIESTDSEYVKNSLEHSAKKLSESGK
ncbi:MAG: HEAT repeat domain-containing protein [Candidatus Ratteibacteria bacterium]|jgi:HEAT repeat protein